MKNAIHHDSSEFDTILTILLPASDDSPSDPSSKTPRLPLKNHIRHSSKFIRVYTYCLLMFLLSPVRRVTVFLTF